MYRAYLAGKIGPHDWRHDLFELRGIDLGLAETWSGRATNYPELRETSDPGGLIYGGPYFISCDHNCYHGPTRHGRGSGDPMACGLGGEPRDLTVMRCQQWIRSADVVFVWLNSTDAYGTLVEIGYAKAIGKPVFIAVDMVSTNEENLANPYREDMWFACHMADKVVETPNHNDGWYLFKKWLLSIIGK